MEKQEPLPLTARLCFCSAQQVLLSPITAEFLMQKTHSQCFLSVTARTPYSERSYCLLKYADFSEHCGCTLSRDDV